MLSLFIDESGQFESGDDCAFAVVGGLLINHQSEVLLGQYEDSLKVRLAEICGANYHQHLHGINRNFRYQDQIIRNIINCKATEVSVRPIFIRRTEWNRMINSNLTDDNTACMLYFNMLNTLVSSVLLYSPDVLEQEREINIHIASRVAVHPARDHNKRVDFESIGLTSRRGNAGDEVYHLNNETSVLVHLNHELRTYPYLESRLNIKISKHWISYERQNCPFMELFYLADIVCNHAYHSIKPTISPNAFRVPLAFAYGDIDNDFRKLFRVFYEKDWYCFFSGYYNFATGYRSKPMHSEYQVRIERLEKRFLAEADRPSVQQFLFKTNQLVNSGNYLRALALYLLQRMGSVLDRLKPDEEVTYYEALLQVYNHLGAYDGGQEIYQKAIRAADRIGSYEMINRKRLIMNRFATTCTNGFDFEQALKLVEQLIDSQLALQDVLQTSDLVIFNRSEEQLFDVTLGKLYSSKGQFLAFLQKKEAYDAFYKALRLFGDNEYNFRQTASYFIHFLAESTIALSDEDKDIVVQYFDGDNLENKIAESLNDGELFRSNPKSFQFFALVKWCRFRQVNIDKKLLIKTARKVVQHPTEEMEHPWQLIIVNLAEMIVAEDKSISRQLLKKAISICEKKENETTLRLMAEMIRVKLARDSRSVDGFIGVLRKLNSPQLDNYFGVQRLQAMNLEEQIKMIVNKFTFTYH